YLVQKIRASTQYESRPSVRASKGAFYMRGLVVAIIGLIMWTGAAQAEPAAKAPQLAVFPRIAASLAPISLSEFVLRAIPTKGQMGWDHLQIDQVRWLTEGIDQTA